MSDALHTEEQKLVKLALQDYESAKYKECLDSLIVLHTLKPNDHKVAANKALVEYLLSGGKGHDMYLKTLDTIITRLNADLKDPLDETDLCILHYNQAMILYSRGNYDGASEVARQSYSLVQTMEDTLAKQISLLLLEILISHKEDIKEGLAVYISIESQISPGKHLKQSLLGGGDHKSSLLVGSSADYPLSRPVSQPSLSSRLVDSARLAAAAPPPRPSPSAVEFRSKLLHFSAKCNIIKGCLDNASDNVDQIFQSGKETFTTRIMLSIIESLKHNYSGGLSTLLVHLEDSASSEPLSILSSIILYNNIGCLYHYLSKPNMSYFYLSKAYNVYKSNLTSFSWMTTKDFVTPPPKMFCPEQLQRFAYNVGVSCLFSNKVNLAFDLLTEAIQVMHKNCVVWLRLSECCIYAIKPDIDKLFDFASLRSEIISEAVGEGPSRKLVLNSNLYKDSQYSPEPQSYAIPVPSAEFGVLCIRNALKLLPADCPKLSQTVFAAYCYLHLSIGDYTEAAKIAKRMVSESVNPYYKWLGRLYLSEALLSLNRIQEAIDCLQPAVTEEPPLIPHSAGGVTPTADDLVTILHYNMAVALTVKGELEKSSEVLKQIWVRRARSESVPIHVISLAIYIELVLGDMDTVNTIIQKNCKHLYQLDSSSSADQKLSAR